MRTAHGSSAPLNPASSAGSSPAAEGTQGAAGLALGGAVGHLSAQLYDFFLFGIIFVVFIIISYKASLVVVCGAFVKLPHPDLTCSCS